MTSLLGTLVLVLAGGLAAPTAPTVPAAASDRAAARTVLDVRDLEQGDPPALAWSERRAGRTVIHRSDGTRTPVGNDLDLFAPMGSGYVVQTAGHHPTTTRWVAADGTPGRGEWRTGAGLAVSPGGHVVAFAGARGRVWTVDREGDRVLRLPRVPVSGTARAVSVAGENCREGEDPVSAGGCSVVANGAHRAEYTTSHGIVDRVPHLRQASTGRGRLLGGITSLSDTGSCSALVRDLRVRWRTCDHQLSDIAPGGRLVLGTPAYADGFGPTTLALLDTADGSPVRTFTPVRGTDTATYFDEVWEDASHVLVVTFQAGEWAVVRLGTDGSREYAVAPRAGSSDTRAPFGLQSR